MYDKDRLLAAIWDNPHPVTGLQFVQRGGTWQSRQRLDGSDSNRSDKTILRRGSNGQIFVNYNGGSFPAGQDIWQYVQWRYNTNDFADVLQIVGDAYGIQPDMTGYTSEQIQRAQQRRTEREALKYAADYIVACMDGEDGKAAREYLNARHLQASARMGAWNRNIKAQLRGRLAKLLNSTTAAEDFLQKHFTRFDAEDYQLAMPYYNGTGNVVGFCLRRTTDNATYTDKNGDTREKPKYLYSIGMPKGGYCETLRGGDEAVLLVEGLLDAEALKQNGFTNVLALGGMTPTDNDEDAAKSTIKTLQRFAAKKLVYIPDCEYNDDGTRKTDATLRTIAALLPHMTGEQHGVGFASLRIADLETEDSKRNHTKEDADTFLQKGGAPAMRAVLSDAAAWYEYELKEAARRYKDDADALATAAVEVFCRINNPTQQQRLKDDITAAKQGYLAQLKAAGVTASALSLIERDGASSTYSARMAAVVSDMGKAKTSEQMAALLTRAQRIQHADTFADFAAQVNITREDMHRLVAAKPEYLQTPWALWKWDSKLQKHYAARCISFAPAAVSIIAAPTNHGKTLVLLQTAIKAAQTTGKRFIYISFENDAEQLYIRAVTAYMGDVWQNATTKDASGSRQPVENPRREVRDIIKAEDCPKELFNADGRDVDIQTYIGRYWRNIAPRLALVRTNADIDAVVNNVQAQVEAWRNSGVEVGGVFVDYLQLLHYPALHAHSRTDEVKGICDRLNDMAKATALPVILAAQFNRDATKAGGDRLDGVELANIGESAGIENIAEDVYLVWQVDKINPDSAEYTSGGSFSLKPYQTRSKRCFVDAADKDTLRRGYLYVENLKARDYATGGYCLLKFNGAAGAITSDESEHAQQY